jgi:hypothetical protein
MSLAPALSLRETSAVKPRAHVREPALDVIPTWDANHGGLEQQERPMSIPGFRCLVAIASAAAFLSGGARADVIVEFGVGLTGSGFAGGPGQSVTTPAGGQWQDITFNFYASATGVPQAEGSIYLFGSAYTGTPQALSSSTPGLLGIASDSGSFYSFAPSLVLSPNSQYFFYSDTRPGGPGGTTVTGNGFGGGTYLNSPNGNGDFFASPGADTAFRLQGTVIPEPATALLVASGLLGLAAIRRRKHARLHFRTAPATPPEINDEICVSTIGSVRPPGDAR